MNDLKKSNKYIIDKIFPLLENKKISVYDVIPYKKMGYVMLLEEKTHSWIYVTIYDNYNGIVITNGYNHGKIIKKIEWKNEDLCFDAEKDTYNLIEILKPIMDKHYIKELKNK